MKITNVLLRDHQLFYNQFDGLERALLAAELVEIKEELARLNLALGLHAELESELLFETLEPIIGEAGPLGVMRLEHVEIERTLTQLQGDADFVETEQLVRHLLEVAREHFAKEELILFPMSEQVLTGEKLDELGAQFEDRRRVVMI